MSVRPVDVVVVVLVAAWALALVVRPDLLWFLCFDDSFYYYEIARNVSKGLGSTFDGVHPTNGYHPLWMWLLVPVFATGVGGTGPVLGILLAQLAAVGTAIRLGPGRILADVGDRGPGVALMGLLLGGPFVLKAMVNGMESALVALFGAGLLWLGWSTGGRVLERPVAVAVLLSLAFLARTDAAFTALVLGLWSLPAAARGGRAGVARLVVAFAPPAAVILGFLACNHLVFGHALQVSGMVKRLEIGPAELGRALGWLAASVLLVVGLRTERARAALPSTARFADAAGWFLVGCGALAGYYTGLQHFARPWYFGPHVLAASVLLPLVLVDRMRADPAGGRGLAALVLAPVLVALPLQVVRIPSTHVIPLRRGQAALATWIDAHLPEGLPVGSWDAGLIGYLSEHPVVNLDAVANDWEYAVAFRAGRTAAWIEAEGLRVFANHGEPRDLPCGHLREEVVRYAGPAHAEDPVLTTWTVGDDAVVLCVVGRP